VAHYHQLHEFIQALRHQDADVRISAALALARIGPAAQAAVPALTETLQDHDADVRRKAAFALGFIGPGAVPALKMALWNPDVDVRITASCSLRRIGAF
jgi:HEAT repeat protein